MKFLLLLAALQADTLTVSMRVEWNRVESTIPEAEVVYAVQDWPVDVGGHAWSIATTTRDTIWEYALVAAYGDVREVCVKALHKLPPQPCPDCGEPFKIEITWCDPEDYPTCKRLKKLYSSSECTRYIP
jgi:hypothetical protein